MSFFNVQFYVQSLKPQNYIICSDILLLSLLNLANATQVSLSLWVGIALIEPGSVQHFF